MDCQCPEKGVYYASYQVSWDENTLGAWHICGLRIVTQKPEESLKQSSDDLII